MTENTVTIKGNKYKYCYTDGETRYLGPVGDATPITEEEFLNHFKTMSIEDGEKFMEKAKHEVKAPYVSAWMPSVGVGDSTVLIRVVFTTEEEWITERKGRKVPLNEPYIVFRLNKNRELEMIHPQIQPLVPFPKQRLVNESDAIPILNDYISEEMDLWQKTWLL